jgi:dimethylamine/trimethylamine dehydrogenase
MTADSRFDILFQPIKLGPVTAKNRFYQVPHCTGMGYERPRTLAAMRGMKAEGGWGVVCTEYCSIHPSSDETPYPFATMWDDDDVKNHAAMTDAVHAHGALAGIELWVSGDHSANLTSRRVPISLNGRHAGMPDPVQTRSLDADDIRDIRRWHVAAAKRALEADFDIVYVYAAHHYLLSTMLSPELNRRTDAYGGSAANRVRLVRELLELVKETVGHRCAVALRWSIEDDEGQITDDRLEMTSLLAGLPDLWDVTIADYSTEMGSSRYVKEGALEDRVRRIRDVVREPVVTVGRYTSPESMLRLVKSGTADFVGAARPSIADPFIPNKIREGRFDDIRECIGCNFCYAHNSRGVPIRCTQNPTMGEEWRRGWHPERIAPRGSDASVLIVGAGPAGLEAARALGQRGYRVTLAEASRQAGGRVTRESTLPGMREWARVRDWRLTQISKMPNVSLYLESRMSAEDVIAAAPDHVVIATGSHWRKDGVGRSIALPVFDPADPAIRSVDEVLAGNLPAGEVAVYDDESYYMAQLVAEKLAAAGCRVTFVGAEPSFAPWTYYTQEQGRSAQRLQELGVVSRLNLLPTGYAGGVLSLACRLTGRVETIAAATLVPVTSRQPDHALHDELAARMAAGTAAGIAWGIKSLRLIGDAEAPATIGHAVYAGHALAQALDTDDAPAQRDRPVIA